MLFLACKGGVKMINDELLERILTSKEMRVVPIGFQSIIIKVISDILYDIERENPYATVSELLSTSSIISK